MSDPPTPDPELQRWDADTYLDWARRGGVPDYDLVQDEVVSASLSIAAASILELGVGTGETARRLLEAHPAADLVGFDASDAMLAAARESLDPARVRLELRKLEDPLPDGEFDLAVSVLAVHHLEGPAKADLFRRLRAALGPGGRFLLGDVVAAERPDDRVTPLSSYDHPSSVSEQLGWLEDAGFSPTLRWQRGDRAVISAAAR